jgi:hypothetical protein
MLFIEVGQRGSAELAGEYIGDCFKKSLILKL